MDCGDLGFHAEVLYCMMDSFMNKSFKSSAEKKLLCDYTPIKLIKYFYEIITRINQHFKYSL